MRTGPPLPPPGESADGRSTRWVDHREARRAELVRIARKVVHQRGPDASMDEIAAAANTSKSIVYRYFSDKLGLQIAVAESVVLQIQGALEGALRASATPREGLRAMVGVYLEMIESSPNVYFFVTREGSLESGSPLGRFLDAVTDLVAAPFARALTEAGSPAGPASQIMAETWASGAVGFVRGAGERWLRHGADPDVLTREELTAQVAAWLWAGPVGFLARGRSAAAPDDAHDDAPGAGPPATGPSTTSPTAPRPTAPRPTAPRPTEPRPTAPHPTTAPAQETR
ncbi:TetR/AcrR family transcriptional regulator [Pengzhenrongella frigida]|uniref:TetR/AcrR family transcriptional regulator n=1 Tax=Pengzhenrongella frigida TaxID=1259133 RepID=UPI001F5C34B5|nr:TetR/AcrR family transcriptional regulator [Cellulomonas sp. HLT2-17]